MDSVIRPGRMPRCPTRCPPPKPPKPVYQSLATRGLTADLPTCGTARLLRHFACKLPYLLMLHAFLMPGFSAGRPGSLAWDAHSLCKSVPALLAWALCGPRLGIVHIMKLVGPLVKFLVVQVNRLRFAALLRHVERPFFVESF